MNLDRIADRVAGITAASKPTKDDVVAFFSENPNPNDKQFHEWAEGKGFDVHEAESIAYQLASKFAAFLVGGRAKEKGMTKDKVDPKELAKGIEVEMEHIDDKEVAERIALDHLAEFGDYYTRLVKMEKEAEK